MEGKSLQDIITDKGGDITTALNKYFRTSSSPSQSILTEDAINTLLNKVQQSPRFLPLVVRCLDDFMSNTQVQREWLEHYNELSQLCAACLNNDKTFAVHVKDVCGMIACLGERGEPLSSTLFNMCAGKFFGFIGCSSVDMETSSLTALNTLCRFSELSNIAETLEMWEFQVYMLAQRCFSLPMDAQISVYIILMKVICSQEDAILKTSIWFQNYPNLQHAFIDFYPNNISEGCGAFLGELSRLSGVPDFIASHEEPSLLMPQEQSILDDEDPIFIEASDEESSISEVLPPLLIEEPSVVIRPVQTILDKDPIFIEASDEESPISEVLPPLHIEEPSVAIRPMLTILDKDPTFIEASDEESPISEVLPSQLIEEPSVAIPPVLTILDPDPIFIDASNEEQPISGVLPSQLIEEPIFNDRPDVPDLIVSGGGSWGRTRELEAPASDNVHALRSLDRDTSMEITQLESTPDEEQSMEIPQLQSTLDRTNPIVHAKKVVQTPTRRKRSSLDILNVKKRNIFLDKKGAWRLKMTEISSSKTRWASFKNEKRKDAPSPNYTGVSLDGSGYW